MTEPDARLSSRELGARELAGYRVLRSLARDSEAEVLLGHRRADAAEPSPSADSRPDPGQTVAIKVSLASASGWAKALRECAALERARGDHVVNLLDLDADQESIRLIFERLTRGDLAELLRIRSRLDAGEAVTLLAPIAVTLLRMHRAGVAHGGVSARTVLFRDDGSPTLIGFSGAEVFEPAAPEVVLEQVEAVRRDRAAIASLALTVLGRVDGSRAHSTRQLIADVEGCDHEFVLPLLASRLFEVAAAQPVRFEPDEREDDIAPSKWRAIPVGVPDSDSDDGPVVAPSALAAAVAHVVPEPLLLRVVATVERSAAAPVVSAVADAVRGRWGAWTTGQRRAALAVAAGAVTVGIVTAVLPAGAAATAPHAGTGGLVSAPSSSASPSAPEPVATFDPAVTADDPVAATGSLLAARNRCLSSLSLPCLERVDEAGSSALADDQSAIRAAQQGGELPDPLPGPPDGGPAVLVERLGDSALVRLGQAASTTSLLLVKADHGWRIRDVIVADAAGSASSTAAPTDG